MPAPLVAAAAAPAVLALAPEAAKLASSVTAHLAAALGTPLLKSETTTFRVTKKGTKTTTTGISLPAWAAVAGGLAALVWFAPPRSTPLELDPRKWNWWPLPF